MEIKEAQKIYNKSQTIEGFMDLYWEFVPEYMTQEKAYEAAERKYAVACRVVTGQEKRKYSNFESFRVARDRYIKSK